MTYIYIYKKKKKCTLEQARKGIKAAFGVQAVTKKRW
jgi:hypothetical protein